MPDMRGGGFSADDSDTDFGGAPAKKAAPKKPSPSATARPSQGAKRTSAPSERRSSGPMDTTPENAIASAMAKIANRNQKGETDKHRKDAEKQFYHLQRLHAIRSGDQETLDSIDRKRGMANTQDLHPDPTVPQGAAQFFGKGPNQHPTGAGGGIDPGGRQGGANLMGSPGGQILAAILATKGMGAIPGLLGRMGGGGAAGGLAKMGEGPMGQASQRVINRLPGAVGGAAAHGGQQKPPQPPGPMQGEYQAPGAGSGPRPGAKNVTPPSGPKPQTSKPRTPRGGQGTQAPPKDSKKSSKPSPSAGAAPGKSASRPEDPRRQAFHDERSKTPQREGESNKDYNRRVSEAADAKRRAAAKPAADKPQRSASETDARRAAAKADDAKKREANPKKEGETDSEYNKRINKIRGAERRSANAAKGGQKTKGNLKRGPHDDKVKPADKDHQDQLAKDRKEVAEASKYRPVKGKVVEIKRGGAKPKSKNPPMPGDKPSKPKTEATPAATRTPKPKATVEPGGDADFKKFQDFKKKYMEHNPKAKAQDVQKAWHAYTGNS